MRLSPYKTGSKQHASIVWFIYVIRMLFIFFLSTAKLVLWVVSNLFVYPEKETNLWPLVTNAVSGCFCSLLEGFLWPRTGRVHRISPKKSKKEGEKSEDISIAWSVNVSGSQFKDSYGGGQVAQRKKYNSSIPEHTVSTRIDSCK